MSDQSNFCSHQNKTKQNKKKKRNKSKFSWLALLFKQFFIKILPNMSEQGKKQQRIYDLLKAETKSKKFPNYNPQLYAICGDLENKTNATSHPNIGSAIEEEWNKMLEEFILKACKLFQERVDIIIAKTTAILSKFTVLCLSSFVVYFLKIKINLIF